MSKTDKYLGAAALFSCPICRAPFAASPAGACLICENGHCYDIARGGYINFAPSAHESGIYDARFFEARRLAARRGACDKLAQAITRLLSANRVRGPILDAGCGDGELTQMIARETGLPAAKFAGIDIARDAIKIAASGPDNGILWCVGDVARLPFADSAFGAVLNILCAANYGGFNRVLTPGGLLLKVLPGPLHYAEIYNHNNMAKPADTQVREQFSIHVTDFGELRVTARFGPEQPQELLSALTEASPLCRTPELNASCENGLTLDWTILYGNTK